MTNCSGTGAITLSDVKEGVSLALGVGSVMGCAGINTNGDGAITIEELVAAVESLIDNCVAPTETQTANPTELATATATATRAIATASPTVKAPTETTTTSPTATPTIADATASPTLNAPILTPVLQNLTGALLSIAGTSPTNMFTVGTNPANDSIGPLILHYDGENWQRLNSKASGNLWWISVTPIDGLFYSAGDGGLILQIDPTSSAITRMTTPTTATLYGVWGTSSSNLWAVGGDVATSAGVVLHYDGSSWTLQDLSGVVSTGLPTLFKVWGLDASDVFAVGMSGTILHYDGANWTQVQSSTTLSLFTVHGDATRVFAVGGFVDGVIVELDGSAFQDNTPPGMPQMNGVFTPSQGVPVSVGIEMSLAQRGADGWQLIQRNPSSSIDFHGTWVDSEGGVWAVGGDLSNLNNGVLQYAGSRTISSTIVPAVPCPLGATGGGTVSWANDVAPLLQQTHCLDAGCHNTVFTASGYLMNTYANAFNQGVEAKALGACPIVPGDTDSSYLLEKLLANPRPTGSKQMPPPPTPPLTDDQMNTIRTWVMEGARDN